MTSRPIHFLDIERLGTGPLCEADGGANSGDPTTVLVERITCEGCQEALNRRLARNRITAHLEHKRHRREDGRQTVTSIGEE
jgi:hypothetical protein